MLSHDNLVSNAETLREVWRFTASDVLIHALPIFHTHGLFVASNVTLFSGASMIFLPKFDPDEIMRAMPNATSLMGVPTFYVRLLQDPRLTREATRHVRLFVSGSAPLLADTHREWFQRTGHAILERYGMTETNMNTSNPYDGERISGSVGLPLPGVSVRIAQPETGEPVPQGEIGMIEVKGPNVFQGYWRMPEKTEAEFRPDGFFITGDLGKIDATDTYTSSGRGKDLIITGGFNVYPKEIESEIDAIDGVWRVRSSASRIVISARASPRWWFKNANSRSTRRTFRALLEARLAQYKLPKRVVFVDELPRNTMGKVQKNLLRERFADLYRMVQAS